MATVERFTLLVPGPPVPLERARSGAHGHHYLPRRSVEFRERVQGCWLAAGRPSLGSQPFSLSVMFHRSSKRGADLDNMVKAICDSLNGLAFADDSQLVCISGAHKVACARGADRSELSLWVASGVTV